MNEANKADIGEWTDCERTCAAFQLYFQHFDLLHIDKNNNMLILFTKCIFSVNFILNISSIFNFNQLFKYFNSILKFET